MIKFEQMRQLCLFLSIAISACSAPSLREDRSPGTSEAVYDDKLASFIAPGYHITDSFYEDMNADSLEDVVLIVAANSSDSAEDPARSMIILSRQPNKQLKESVRNDYFLSGVPCNSGTEEKYFYPRLSINPDASFGIYSFTYKCGEGHYESTLVFRYSQSKKDWLLDSYIHNSISAKNGTRSIDSSDSFNKSAQELGEIRFSNFSGETDYRIHFPNE